MEPLADAMPFSPTLAVEKPSGDPPVVRLPLRERPSASEVNLLDTPHAVERYADEPRSIARRADTVEGILVRVQGNRPVRLVRCRCLLAHDDDDPPRDHGEGSEPP